jgi:hypothetical protein
MRACSWVLLFACASCADAPDALTAAEPQAVVTTVLHEDFEAHPFGPLAAPWQIVKNVEASPGSATIVSAAERGKALLLHGSSLERDYLIATLGATSSAPRLGVSVALSPDTGAAFVFSLNGSGAQVPARKVRLLRAPGSSTLVASASPSGDTSCAPLPSGAWTDVTLVVNTATHPFEVLVDGEPTACTGLATGIAPPWSSVAVSDSVGAGWGGNVRVDDISLTAF